MTLTRIGLAVATVASAAVLVAAPAHAGTGTVAAPLRTAVADLQVAPRSHAASYDRAWVRFYNDLGDARSLAAVDRHDNEAKGASSPDAWMPSHGHCRYTRAYVAVKTRWRLTVTRPEKKALASYAAACADRTLKVTRATVRLR